MPLFFGFDSSRIPTPGNAIQGKKMLMLGDLPGNQPGVKGGGGGGGAGDGLMHKTPDVILWKREARITYTTGKFTFKL